MVGKYKKKLKEANYDKKQNKKQTQYVNNNMTRFSTNLALVFFVKETKLITLGLEYCFD